MRYPLSYTVYSPMFDALPTAARYFVVERLAAVLTGRDAAPRYAHLGAEARQAVIEILRETKPALADALH